MTPFVQDVDFTLYQGDVLDVLRELPSESVDCCITDPPYNVGKDYGQNVDDRRPDYLEWLGAVVVEISRVVRDGLVFFPGTSNLFSVPEVLGDSGFHVQRVLAVHRREFAGDKWMGGPAMCWEPVVWASKIEKPHFNRIFGNWGRDFLVVNSPRHEAFYGEHPCPKATDAHRWLVGLFVPPQGSVLDCFAGTGPTLEAARERGCTSIGVELNPKFVAMCVSRLSQQSLLMKASA